MLSSKESQKPKGKADQPSDYDSSAEESSADEKNNAPTLSPISGAHKDPIIGSPPEGEFSSTVKSDSSDHSEQEGGEDGYSSSTAGSDLGNPNDTMFSVASAKLFGSSSRGEVITVLARVDDEGGIEVLISDDRPSMRIAGAKDKDSQGDHVTAYVNFLEMICIAVDEEEVHNIPDQIASIAKCVLDKKDQDCLDLPLAKLKSSQETHMSRTERKQLTRLLRELASKESHLRKVVSKKSMDAIAEMGKEPVIEKLKNTMKDGDKLILVNAINKLGGAFLTNIQQGSDIAFAKIPSSQQSEEEKKEAKAEGTLVKMASYGLKSFSRLVKLKADIEAVTAAEGKKETEDSTRKGNSIQAFIDDLKLPRSILTSGLVVLYEAFIDPNLTTDLEERKRKAKSHIDKKVSTLLKKTDFKQQKKDLLALANEIIGNENNEKLFSKLGNLFEDMFDFKFSRHKDDLDAEDVLYKLMARHIVIMFTAFKGLKQLSPIVQKKIISCFIQEGVLRKENWQAFSVISTPTGDIKKLDVEYIQQKVKGTYELGGFTDSQNFSLLKKEGDKDAVSQKSSKANQNTLSGGPK